MAADAHEKRHGQAKVLCIDHGQGDTRESAVMQISRARAGKNEYAAVAQLQVAFDARMARS